MLSSALFKTSMRAASAPFGRLTVSKFAAASHFRQLSTKAAHSKVLQHLKQQSHPYRLYSSAPPKAPTETHTALPSQSPTEAKLVPAPAKKKSRGAMSKGGLQIILSMFKYVWPKGDWATKSRVITAIVLMLGSKLLNVQVPMIFKNIVDGLNVDVAMLGGTLSTVATAMLVG
ncbi:Iron-sulfur clusters transporter atm1, mitochondrial, partial [Linderina pennispora]